MPELPEVEQFRQILLPLVSPLLPSTQSDQAKLTKKNPLNVSLVTENYHRRWLSQEQVEEISGKCYCVDIIRKGKQLCMILEMIKNGNDTDTDTSSSARFKYLFLHMGMTGHITAPNRSCCMGFVKNKERDVFPPKYTYLLLSTADYQTAFADPRKFGCCYLCNDTKILDALAPDALVDDLPLNGNTDPHASSTHEQIIAGLTNQSLGIKAVLLDQKRVLSGVGNWVADESLYQCKLHPDQTHLSTEQAHELFHQLRSILITAIDCLKLDQEYPISWLFGYRWTNKKKGTDALGRSLTFVTSGGRTSAIVTSIQQLRKNGVVKTVAKTTALTKSALSQKTKRTTSEQITESLALDSCDECDSDSAVKKSDKKSRKKLKKVFIAIEDDPLIVLTSAALDSSNECGSDILAVKKSDKKRRSRLLKVFVAVEDDPLLVLTSVVPEPRLIKAQDENTNTLNCPAASPRKRISRKRTRSTDNAHSNVNDCFALAVKQGPSKSRRRSSRIVGN